MSEAERSQMIIPETDVGNAHYIEMSEKAVEKLEQLLRGMEEKWEKGDDLRLEDLEFVGEKTREYADVKEAEKGESS